MICKRCGKEINEKKSFIQDTHMGVCIGYMHMACFNRTCVVHKPSPIDGEEENDQKTI